MSHSQALGAAADPTPSSSPLAPRHAVVVAHPDDEALWLSSALTGAARIVFCFGAPWGKPEKARARRSAVAALALPGLVDLAIPESGAGFCFDWQHPRWSGAGLAIADREAQARYHSNFETLTGVLGPLLADVDTVYTHNPWGEYGHAEHVQVYRALSLLQQELHFTLWFSNYVGDRSWPMAKTLADRPLWSLRRHVASEAEIAQRLRRIYLHHGAWTWNRTHRWPKQEQLYAQPARSAANRQALRGENLIDVAALSWWPLNLRPLLRPLL